MSPYSFNIGDYVVYEPGYKRPEIGRVASIHGDSVYVCYHEGCTAASTPDSMIRPATESEVACCDMRLGFHRFDEYCEERDETLCFMCNAKGMPL